MNTPLAAHDVMVRVQSTPNPNALKFVVNTQLKNEGKATFNDIHESSGLPLVESVFTIPGVKQVYLFQNTMTVTHTGDMDNDLLAQDVEAILKTRIPIHKSDFKAPDEQPKAVEAKDRSNLSDEMKQIEEILDRTIRPGLQSDGGDVEIISFKDNELRILYQGACGGCPSSMMGTLDAIQGILQHELANDQIRVVPI